MPLGAHNIGVTTMTSAVTNLASHRMSQDYMFNRAVEQVQKKNGVNIVNQSSGEKALGMIMDAIVAAQQAHANRSKPFELESKFTAAPAGLRQIAEDNLRLKNEKADAEHNTKLCRYFADIGIAWEICDSIVEQIIINPEQKA